MAYFFDHNALNKAAEGEGQGCVVIGCGKGKNIICEDCLKKHGLKAGHLARLWLLAYNYYHQGMKFRTFFILVKDIEAEIAKNKKNNFSDVFLNHSNVRKDLIEGMVALYM